MIHFITPYSKGNLGQAYNQEIERLPHDHWVCIMDMDVCVLNNKIPEKMYEYIEQFYMIDIFTCYTNRIGGYRTQLYKNELSENSDIKYHKELTDLLIKKPNTIKHLTFPISGFCMLFKVRTWFDLGGFEDGIFVDGKFSQKALHSGKKIALMENIYLFHYYRLLEGKQYKGHLI